MKLTISVLIAILALCISASAAVPPMMSYQGKLLQPSGAPVPDGTYSMQFCIYDVPTGGTALWSETNPSVQVKGGLFATMLGSVVNLPANVFDNPNRFFGVKVGTDPEMTPRQQVASSAFAFRAAVAGTVDDGAITTSKLADGAVTSDRLADGAVATAKIADSTVSTAKISDSAITTPKIANGAVTPAKLSRTLTSASVSTNWQMTAANTTYDVLTVTIAPTQSELITVTALIGTQNNAIGCFTSYEIHVDGQIQTIGSVQLPSPGTGECGTLFAMLSVGPGSHTIKLKARSCANNTYILGTNGNPVPSTQLFVVEG